MNKKNKVGRPQKGLYSKGPNTALSNHAFTYAGKYLIYGLASNKAPENVLYIGYTSLQLNVRYNNHMADAIHSNTAKAQWIHDLLANGEKLVMVAIEDGIPYRDDACKREQYYIQQLKEAQVDYKNSTLGGMGTLGRIVSEASREKHSISMKGKQCRLGTGVTKVSSRKITASKKNRKERSKKPKQNQ